MTDNRTPRRRMVLALLLAYTALGCPVALPENASVGFHCTASDDCGRGLICANERCVAPFTVDASQIVDARADTAAASDRATADQVAGDATASDRGSVDGTVVDAGVHDVLAADQAADHRLPDQGAADAHASDGNIEDASGADLAIEDATATDLGIEDHASPDQTPVNPCTLAGAVAIHAASPIAVDGQPTDWGHACFSTMQTPDNWGDSGDPPPADYSSFGASFALQWRADALDLWVEVVDDVQHNDKDGALIWNDDSVQAALDLDCSGGTNYSAGDFEFGWALANNLQRSYRWYPDPSSPTLSHLVRRNDAGHRTFYEAVLTSADLGGHSFVAGDTICFSLLINEADSGDRIGWLEWGSGIAVTKVPDQFRPVLLAP